MLSWTAVENDKLHHNILFPLLSYFMVNIDVWETTGMSQLVQWCLVTCGRLYAVDGCARISEELCWLRKTPLHLMKLHLKIYLRYHRCTTQPTSMYWGRRYECDSVFLDYSKMCMMLYWVVWELPWLLKHIVMLLQLVGVLRHFQPTRFWTPYRTL